jgi:ABC-type uncharacterized transport system substrate-binding protein
MRFFDKIEEVAVPVVAAELVGRDVAAIFATDVPSAFAAKAATKTLPIVFITGADPVKVGLVDRSPKRRRNSSMMRRARWTSISPGTFTV